MGKKQQKTKDERKILVSNRKARFQFHIIESMEAGIVLQGTEVKSLRAGDVNLVDSFAMIQDGEIHLRNLHVGEYKQGSWTNHEPKRRRKLLLHRAQIVKLGARVTEEGLTLVPLSLYLSERGLVKVELALVKGKKTHDKRESLKKQEHEREMQRHTGKRGGW
jgi:SsrA-binding protein